MTVTQTPLRNADLDDLLAVLRSEADSKLDVIVPGKNLRSEGGLIHVVNGAVAVDEEGVSLADAVLRPTRTFDGHVADRLGIPVKYVRRLREEATDLYDENVNYWLKDAPETKHMVRAFHDGDPGSEGVARALLSNSYGLMDDVDMLAAALQGLKKAGIDPVSIDLTADRGTDRLFVKIVAPEIAIAAPELLAGYRSPFDTDSPAWRAHSGYAPGTEPIIEAGLKLNNSETGGGAWSITPYFRVQICTNGLVIVKDAVRHVHLGAKLEEGVIRWSEETRNRTLELVTAKTADAVKTFLDVEYLRSTVADLTVKAGVEITDPVTTIQRVSDQLKFTEAERDGIFADFVRGGQLTAGGVAQAVTAYAERIEDPERANDVEALGVEALTLAAA